MARSYTLCGCLAVLIVFANCAHGTDDAAGLDLSTGGDAGGSTDDVGLLDSGSPSSQNDDASVGQGQAKPMSGEDSGTPGTGSMTTGDDSGAAVGEDAASSAPDANMSTGPTGDDAGPRDAGKGSSPVPPTTCTGADEAYGCCIGDTLYYCNNTSKPTSKTCTGGKVCGWEASEKYYDCVEPPATISSSHPIACQ